MARVSHRWQFGHPSTSELDQNQGGICKLALAGDRKSFLVAVCFARATTRLGYRVFSGLFRMRDVRCWHFSDIEPARFNVRFRALFGHQRMAGLGRRVTHSRPWQKLDPRGTSPGRVWMIATMEPGMIGLMEPLETPSNQGLGEQVI